MMRSIKQRKEAQRMFLKYTEKYNFLAGMGDRRMGKARREANKVLENWMVDDRLGDPQEPGQEGSNPISRSHPSTPARAPKGRVRKLTEFFNNIRGPGPPRTPSKSAKDMNLTNLKKSGGVRKPRKRNKNKIEEPQRAKMEEAMRKFLGKAPD